MIYWEKSGFSYVIELLDTMLPKYSLTAWWKLKSSKSCWTASQPTFSMLQCAFAELVVMAGSLFSEVSSMLPMCIAVLRCCRIYWLEDRLLGRFLVPLLVLIQMLRLSPFYYSAQSTLDRLLIYHTIIDLVRPHSLGRLQSQDRRVYIAQYYDSPNVFDTALGF